MIFTGLAKPFKTMRENFMDKLNEWLMLFISYGLFVFTDWVDDVEL